MSEIKLSLYGERHADEHLLRAYKEIFSRAQKGSICFIECSTCEQSLWDNRVAEVLSRNLDPQKTLAIKIVEYNTAYKNASHVTHGGVILRKFMYDFKILLSAFTGIRLVCSDVSEKDPKLEQWILYTSLRQNPAFLKTDQRNEILTRTFKCSVEEAVAICNNFETEIIDGTYVAKRGKELAARLSQDRKIADFMLTHMNGLPAIALYGKNHCSFDRLDSLATILDNKLGSAVAVFEISSGQIFPTRKDFPMGQKSKSNPEP